MFEKELDHVGVGLAKLLQQFQGKPRMTALASSYLARVQEIEDAAWQLLLERALDTAIGAQLDDIGDLVGQKRNGLVDDSYRIVLRARIKVNRSGGHAPELLEIASLLVPESQIIFREFRVAAIYMRAVDPVVAPVDVVVFDFLGRAVAAGVLLCFLYGLVARAQRLRFTSVRGGVTNTRTNRAGSAYQVDIGGGRSAGVFEVTGS